MKWMNEWPISHLLVKEDVQPCPFCTKHFLLKDIFLSIVTEKMIGKG